ncbi:MAG: hypothetical protein GY838_05440 [bacterium]|nr:hypothetical protein [bacterium]
MSDREFDELVDAMRENHNKPPQTPRDRMWERIEAARSERKIVRMPARPWYASTWVRAGLSAAAVLVLGIAIGRMTTTPDAPPMVADSGSTPPTVAVPTGEPAPRSEATTLVRHAAQNLFGRADVLLTDLKISSCSDTKSRPVPAWAGGMLAQTRLLLDSPLCEDVETRALLLDLELVLARIAGLSNVDCTGDVNRIRRDLNDNATLDRLRLAAAGQGMV